MNAQEVFQIMNVKPELIRQFRNMTELEQFQLCYLDPLTGLYSRRAFEMDEREGVLLLDLDSFKWINDTFGHSIGDVTLIEFADLLVHTFGKDNCYRIGGDEFAVKFLLRPNLAAVARHTMNVGTLRLTFPGVSFGIGSSVSKADQKLYENKKKRESNGTRATPYVEPPWAEEYRNKYPPLPSDRREVRDL